MTAIQYTAALLVAFGISMLLTVVCLYVVEKRDERRWRHRLKQDDTL